MHAATTALGGRPLGFRRAPKVMTMVFFNATTCERTILKVQANTDVTLFVCAVLGEACSQVHAQRTIVILGIRLRTRVRSCLNDAQVLRAETFACCSQQCL